MGIVEKGMEWYKTTPNKEGFKEFLEEIESRIEALEKEFVSRLKEKLKDEMLKTTGQ